MRTNIVSKMYANEKVYFNLAFVSLVYSHTNSARFGLVTRRSIKIGGKQKDRGGWARMQVTWCVVCVCVCLSASLVCVCVPVTRHRL